MSKIELNTTIADYGWSQINANFQEIEDELNEKVLYRDNPVGEPNTMENDLDLNGNRIINLPEPLSNSEPARLQDLQGVIAGEISAILSPFTPYETIVGPNVQLAIQQVKDFTDSEITGRQAADATITDRALYRVNPDGKPNTMQIPLDMNSNKVVNLAAPTNPNDAARLADVTAATSGNTPANLSAFSPYQYATSTNVQGAIQDVINGLQTTSGASRVNYTGGVGQARSVQSRLDEFRSVKDFGAVGDNVTDDSAAFQATVNGTVDRQIVRIPWSATPYRIVTAPSAKNIFWFNEGSVPNYGSLYDLTGTVIGGFENSFMFSKVHGLATDTSMVRIRRVADYSGGSPGYVNPAILGETIAQAGGTSYEWAAVFKIENNRTPADNSEEVAMYAQATKKANGKTFAALSELIDQSTSPTTSSVAHEFDMRGRGIDTSNNRIMCHLVATSENGTTGDMAYGIRFSPSGNFGIRNAISLDGTNFSKIIESNNYTLNFDGSWSSAFYTSTSAGFAPTADNARQLGFGGLRWSTIWGATGVVSTSDERDKQQIQPIDERALKAWAKVEYVQYKFNDAVELKGDQARWHTGVIAQRVQEAFESEGLDAFAYGILCIDAGRYGVRYEEAMTLELALMRKRLEALEQK